ncbi:glycosyltransferase [Marisediminicola senii]
MYPRFSETFVVSEILAREAAGEDIAIFSLRPPVDPRFHPELARITAPVVYIDRPTKTSVLWMQLRSAALDDPDLGAAIARCLPELLAAEVDDAVQAVILARAVLDAGVTHLHAHFASLATTVARLASMLTGVPYSFTAHAKDLFHESVDAAALADKLRDAHHVVTVSDYNDVHLREAYPDETGALHRLYNGLELRRFPYREARPRGGRLRVVAVGRLVEKKGFDLLIDAAALLHLRGIDLDVRIAGGGELADALAERITALALDGVVTLLGPRAQSEVVGILDDADVFVAPCIVGSDGNADGLPTTILEAMAMGVPVVSTDVTGIPEVVRDGETGILCRAGDVTDLVDAIARIADGSVDTVPLARAARHLVEQQFDSVNQAARLRELVRGGAGVAGSGSDAGAGADAGAGIDSPGASPSTSELTGAVA